MANNLRYLLEHFCLDGQTIDISSELDEQNAENIEKINTETVPSINQRIDEIKDTDIPNINSRIDGIKNTDIPAINQKINSINNVSIPTLDRRITGVDDKADSINTKAEKNSKDIATLSDNMTMQGNDINSINTEKLPSIEKTVNDNTTKISEIKNTDIPNLNGRIDTADNNVTALTQRVSDNETNIEGVTQNVNDLVNNVISPIKDDVTNLKTKTTDLESDLTELRDVTVDELSKNVEDLTTKVSTNTEGINTINNTSIPNLQNQIDSLSSGGSGSIEDLREKVQTNTNDISTLTNKVDKNTNDISTINETSIPNLQNEIDNFNVGSWVKVYENTKHTHSGTITQYFNEKLKLACMTIQFSTKDTTWNDRGQGITWEIEGIHNPLTNVSGIIRLVSGLHYICGIINVSKDNRINGTLIEAMPSRDLSGSYVLYGSVLYPTE